MNNKYLIQSYFRSEFLDRWDTIVELARYYPDELRRLLKGHPRYE